MKKFKIHYSLCFFPILYSLFLIFNSSEVQAATLSLSPSSGNYSSGQTFTVNILLDTKGAAVDGVDILYLNYDPDNLGVVDDNASQSGIQITPGALMPMTLANTASNGKITFSQISAGGTTFTSSGAEILATIHFKVIKAADTRVYFDFVVNGTADTNVASKGKDILTAVTNGNYGPSSQPLAPTPPAPSTPAPSTPAPSTPAPSMPAPSMPAPTPSTPPSPSPGTPLFVTGPFAINIVSEQVKILQQIFAQDKTIYPEALITGKYDDSTVKAVQNFQCKYLNICSGTPNTTGYGLVGPITRAKINEIFWAKTAILSINRNLYFGLKHQEVTSLQQYLSQDKTIYPEAMVTGYFGSLTQKAVQRFQCKYNIVCSGTPNTTGYGFVGPKTRARINELLTANLNDVLE